MKCFWALFAVAAVLLTFVPFAGARSEVVDRIVAVVNDDIIRLREVERQLEPVRQQLASRNLSEEQMREQLYEARMQLIDELINETLADQQIEQAGIQVGKAEVDAAIEQVKQRNYYTDEQLRQALEMQGMSMEQYRGELRRQILRSRLVNRKVKSSIVITDEDIDRYYKENPEKYGGKPRYKIRNILLAGTDKDSDDPEIRRRIKKIREQLDEGVSFGTLAEKYSQGPNADEGGELGEFAVHDLARDLRPVIGDLNEGEVSDGVETRQGIQIFYVEKIIEAPSEPLASVAAEIEEKLYNEQVNKKYRAWLESLRENAHIRIFR
ncbi:peptidyl-prolyl cis-trans isomerase SurA [Desulfosalsimonas propionicica]|uniref:Peptidyl-prolyl cis-trans isomerase SurA n=1 Tax=Desulfosalsimonas propionicica TaxID=332175 RepID=A0A7W0HKW9_9BACT|nr:SurA N-terminal domain-containing protein [Desulfosalsimonas propionicica]MBA2881687.1 peptidyl-prolyl cis-trans isomerase SurA [Desulfosalsimonas propionicica]